VIGRRECLKAGGAALVLSAWPLAQAGGQLEEPLADSVRTALSSAIANSAPPIPEFRDTEARLSYLRWLGAMSQRLARKKTEWLERKEFLQTVWYESKRAGLDPMLVLGLIQVESNFRKYAVSPVGARGYMQVMPFWTAMIGTAEQNLFNLRTNLRYGCVILRHYLDMERGDMQRALARYNGSLGKKSTYADNVLHAWRARWSLSPTRVVARPMPARYMGEP